MDVLAPLRQLSAWFSRQSRTVKDLIVIGFVVLPIFVAAVWYDAFDRFLQLTNQPQSDAFDWLVILVVCLGLAAKVYAIRRVIDLRREVGLRRKAETEAHQMARHDVLTGLPTAAGSRFERRSNSRRDCALPSSTSTPIGQIAPTIYSRHDPASRIAGGDGQHSRRFAA